MINRSNKFTKHLSPEMIVENIISRIEGHAPRRRSFIPESMQGPRRRVINEMAMKPRALDDYYYHVTVDGNDVFSKEEAKAVALKYKSERAAAGDKHLNASYGAEKRIMPGSYAQRGAGMVCIYDKFRDSKGDWVTDKIPYRDQPSDIREMKPQTEEEANKWWNGGRAEILNGIKSQRQELGLKGNWKAGNGPNAAPQAAVFNEEDMGAFSDVFMSVMRDIASAKKSGTKISGINIFDANLPTAIQNWIGKTVAKQMLADEEVSSTEEAIMNKAAEIISSTPKLQSLISAYAEVIKPDYNFDDIDF